MRTYFIYLCLFLCVSCSNKNNETEIYREWAKEYYNSYAKKDLDKWIGFYNENSEIHDITTGIVMKNRDSILPMVTPAFNGTIPFYKDIKWNISHIVADGNKVSVKGSISNAYYKGKILPQWDFISLIEFNNAGKIIKQFDFVNYPKLD
ncbi:nuclear transport factor 2 family protein [Aquimarina aggregata]|uniref:nuclear transport factor 2 family protein n=1 Tax=Aquimarina aggregata TaxID=1642818 RepID=UPI0024926121|nr:nuclear transport factor 2 family protein [Aquimarina aggregata]